MRLSERLYRILLMLYPRRFLREYNDPLQQAFRDQSRNADTRAKRLRLWRRIVMDLARSAPAVRLNDMRSHGMRITGPAAYLLCLAAMIFLGRFELHTDDAGVEVCFILLLSLILGCLHPRRAWLWALAGLCIPAADLVWRPSTLSFSNPSGFVILAAVVTGIGLAGSYSGVLLRKIIGGLRM